MQALNTLLGLTLLLLIQTSLAAAGKHGHGHATSTAQPAFCKTEGLAQGNPGCGRTPTAAFTDKGELKIVYVDGDSIKLTSSSDKGKTFTDAIRITPQPERIYADGENRPKIVIGQQGQIYLSWVQKTEGKYTGDIRFSHSLDGGKSFSVPVTVNDDGLLTSHRFDTLAVGPDGRVHITWLDKRDLVAAKKAGTAYRGAALYHATSTDNGATFSRNKKIADHSCECCRIGLAFDQAGDALALWRHVFEGGIRDHAIINLDSKEISQTVTRATFDNWQINACPHHGPDMAIDAENNLQLFWFTGAENRGGLYYGRYNRSKGELDRQIRIDAASTASRPQIITQDNKVLLVWKVFDGVVTKLQLKSSDDEGLNWSETQTLTTTAGDSDHPQLFNNKGINYVSWWTDTEGFRLLTLD